MSASDLKHATSKFKKCLESSREFFRGVKDNKWVSYFYQFSKIDRQLEVQLTACASSINLKKLTKLYTNANNAILEYRTALTRAEGSHGDDTRDLRDRLQGVMLYLIEHHARIATLIKMVSKEGPIEPNDLSIPSQSELHDNHFQYTENEIKSYYEQLGYADEDEEDDDDDESCDDASDASGDVDVVNKGKVIDTSEDEDEDEEEDEEEERDSVWGSECDTECSECMNAVRNKHYDEIWENEGYHAGHDEEFDKLVDRYKRRLIKESGVVEDAMEIFPIEEWINL